MKLTPIKANMTELEIPCGNNETPIRVLFSYQTPVATYDDVNGYRRTTKKWSMTTTRHINQWMKGFTGEEVDQSELDDLVK